jgi:hypothetical protein
MALGIDFRGLHPLYPVATRPIRPVCAAAGPALAYKESLQPNGARFQLMSELNSLGEEKLLLLRTCGIGGPNQIKIRRIRHYYDPESRVHLWIITKENRKDVLFYSSEGFTCTVEQQ